MNPKNEAKKIIESLRDNHLYAVCPCPDCQKEFLLRDAGLFYLDNFTEEGKELYQTQLDEIKQYDKDIRERRRQIKLTSKVGAEAVNIGMLLERLAPCMETFPFDRNDCRSLFDPIDYIIFDGLRKQGSVKRIVFMDIKTGKARLKSSQKEIRSLVERKKVSWDTYRMEVKK